MKPIPLTASDQALATTLRALGHPARLRMVRLLAERKECVCGDLVDDLPLAQPTVSQHLKVLKEAGLVAGAVEGPSVCYCLNPQALGALRDGIDDLLVALDQEESAAEARERSVSA